MYMHAVPTTSSLLLLCQMSERQSLLVIDLHVYQYMCSTAYAIELLVDLLTYYILYIHRYTAYCISVSGSSSYSCSYR